MSWIKKTIDFYAKNEKKYLQKILLGIPFHGAKIKENSEINILTGKSIREILNENKEKNLNLVWDSVEMEHNIKYVEYEKDCNIFFPSKKVIFFNYI